MTERQASLQIADQLMQDVNLDVVVFRANHSFAVASSDFREIIARRRFENTFPQFQGCLSLPKLNISADAGTMVLASGSFA
jgi:hypothetical protein